MEKEQSPSENRTEPTDVPPLLRQKKIPVMHIDAQFSSRMKGGLLFPYCAERGRRHGDLRCGRCFIFGKIRPRKVCFFLACPGLSVVERLNGSLTSKWGCSSWNAGASTGQWYNARWIRRYYPSQGGKTLKKGSGR